MCAYILSNVVHVGIEMMCDHNMVSFSYIKLLHNFVWCHHLLVVTFNLKHGISAATYPLRRGRTLSCLSSVLWRAVPGWTVFFRVWCDPCQHRGMYTWSTHAPLPSGRWWELWTWPHRVQRQMSSCVWRARLTHVMSPGHRCSEKFRLQVTLTDRLCFYCG